MSTSRITETLKSDSVKAASAAGLVEVAGFHPVDTCIKRLQKNQGKMYEAHDPYKIKFSKTCEVIFKNSPENSHLLYKWALLYRGTGLPWALGYKVLQRALKLGGQPIFQDYLHSNYDNTFKQTFGVYALLFSHIVSGGLLGGAELSLLPLDAMKIKYQTNIERYKGKGIFQVMREENLLKGLGVTWWRNVLGSGSMYAALFLIKTEGFGLAPEDKMSYFQNMTASVCASAASIAVSNPLDVIRTRLVGQEKSINSVSMAIQMAKEEGPSVFAKGLTPKLISQGPKVAFALYLTNQLISVFANKRKNPDDPVLIEQTKRPKL